MRLDRRSRLNTPIPSHLLTFEIIGVEKLSSGLRPQCEGLSRLARQKIFVGLTGADLGFEINGRKVLIR